MEANEEATAAYNRAVSLNCTRYVLVLRVTVQDEEFSRFQNILFIYSSLLHCIELSNVSQSNEFYWFSPGNKTP